MIKQCSSSLSSQPTPTSPSTSPIISHPNCDGGHIECTHAPTERSESSLRNPTATREQSQLRVWFHTRVFHTYYLVQCTIGPPTSAYHSRSHQAHPDPGGAGCQAGIPMATRRPPGWLRRTGILRARAGRPATCTRRPPARPAEDVTWRTRLLVAPRDVGSGAGQLHKTCSRPTGSCSRPTGTLCGRSHSVHPCPSLPDPAPHAPQPPPST